MMWRQMLLTGLCLLALLWPAQAEAPLAPEPDIRQAVTALQQGTVLPYLPERYRDHLAMFLLTYQQTRLAGGDYEAALRVALITIAEESHQAIVGK